MKSHEIDWQDIARKRMRLLWLGLVIGLIIGGLWGWCIGYNDGLIMGGTW